MSHQNVLISLRNLSPDHLEPFHVIVSSILSTSLAEQTFSQIIDRLPISSVYEKYGNRYRPDIDGHKTLCSKSVDAWKTFRRQFAPHSLEIDVKLVQRYQNSTIGSKEFKLLLLEIIAVAVHKIAVLLYQNFNHTSHTREEREEALKAPRPEWSSLPQLKPEVVDLYHPRYVVWEQYPEGVSDMVGYWAEYQLFGGVILFDREASGDKNTEAFVDPTQCYRVFQLSTAQIQEFLSFSANSSELQPLPFPFTPEKQARMIDPRSTRSLHIYRNLYDRDRRPPGRTCRMDPGEAEKLQEVFERFMRERANRQL